MEHAPETMSVGEAAMAIGTYEMDVRRRVDAWLAGDRTPYALMGDRKYGTRGARRVYAVDVERARRQKAGEIPTSVTAEQYAAERR